MSARDRLLASIAFGVTMAVFEASVVVYLRRLWDLGEIDIVNASLKSRLILTEVLREAASLGMIASVAVLGGRRGVERLAHAAIIFGTWDILYYVLLNLLIGWPASLFEWDVLFLIPRPWIGPVLAPVLVSLALIASGLAVVSGEARGRPLRPRILEWLAGLVGGGIVIGSFVIVDVPPTRTAIPEGFSWPLFLLGLALAVCAFASALAAAYRRR